MIRWFKTTLPSYLESQLREAEINRADWQITAEHSQAMADMLEDRIIRLKAELELATAAPVPPVAEEPLPPEVMPQAAKNQIDSSLNRYWGPKDPQYRPETPGDLRMRERDQAPAI